MPGSRGAWVARLRFAALVVGWLALPERDPRHSAFSPRTSTSSRRAGAPGAATIACAAGAPPAGQLAAAAAAADAEGFLRELVTVPDGREKFRLACAAITPLAGSQGSQWDFMLRCLESLAGPSPPAPATLATLISGLRPPPPPDPSLSSVDCDTAALRRRALAAALALRAPSAGQETELSPKASRKETRALRNAARVLEAWGLREDDASGPEELRAVAQMLGDLFTIREWDQLADLLPAFPSLAADLDFASAAAELKTRHALPKGGKRSARRLSEAVQNGLEPEEAEEVMLEAISAGTPLRAVAACGRSQRLRRRCAELLVREGYVDLAEDLAEGWWLPLEASPEARASQEAREQGYVQLPPDVELVTVELEEQLSAAFERLRGERVVGLDVEMSGGKAVLAQLAAGDRVFLLDLLALGALPSLGELFGGLLADAGVAKLGFGAKEDVRTLLRLPGMASCRGQLPEALLDLQQLAAEQRAKRRPGSSKKEELQGLSLSRLALDLLGKPLDKSLRMSDWARRPLREAQRRYAALDAWVLPGLFERLRS